MFAPKYRFKIFVSLLLFLLSACSNPEPAIQGYIEVRLAFITAKYSGVLQQLFVKRGDEVKPGQPLFVLEAQPESDDYLHAKADVDDAIAAKNEAEATVAHQKILLSRRETLAAKGIVAVETLDIAQIDYKKAVTALAAAEAKVSAAKAKLEQASWSKSKKSVMAEQKGRVFDTYFLPSELVPENQAVLSLIIPTEVRVIFFITEPKLSSIKVGDIINVKCDGYAKLVPAKINYISQRAELTPPVLYSMKERAKFLYRVEAERLTSDSRCFHPGQPVNIFLKAEPKNEKNTAL